MVEVPIDYLMLFLILMAIAIVILLSVFYDYYEGKSYTERCIQSLFYCKKCNSVFSINGEMEFHACPGCGTQKTRLKF